MESLETSKVRSNASGALRVVGVGPSKVTGEWPSDAQVPSEAVRARRGSGVEPPEPPIYGLKKHWFRDLIQGCRLHLEVAVWGPQLGTGVGPSQPPVRALAGAVVGPTAIGLDSHCRRVWNP